MSYIYKSRVRETTTTAGTGTVALGGAQYGYQTFGSAIPSGTSVEYTIEDAVNGLWEVGHGTYTSSSNTLSRDTVLESSNGGQPVGFGSGIKSVWLDLSAASLTSLTALANGALPASSLVSTLATTQARILAPVGSLVGSGTGQSNGTSLSYQVNVLTSAPAGTAFVIPVSNAGQTIEIRNKDTANAASLYPPVGARIDSNAINAPVTLPSGSAVVLVVASTTQIWS
jgi:hypothetical protein